MAEYSTIADEVRRYVAGCTIPLIVHAIRDSVIEVCKAAKLIKRPISAQAVTLDNPRVLIVPTTGYRLIHLQNVTLDKRAVNHTSQDTLDLAWSNTDHPLRMQINWHHDDCRSGSSESWRSYKQDRPRLYYVEKEDAGDFFRFVGIPQRSYADLEYTKIVCPTRESTSIDTWFLDRYYKELAWGAAGDLMMMPKTTWNDPVAGAMYRSKFDTWLAQAAGDAARDFTRDDESVGRVTSHY